MYHPWAAAQPYDLSFINYARLQLGFMPLSTLRVAKLILISRYVFHCTCFLIMSWLPTYCILYHMLNNRAITNQFVLIERSSEVWINLRSNPNYFWTNFQNYASIGIRYLIHGFINTFLNNIQVKHSLIAYETFEKRC